MHLFIFIIFLFFIFFYYFVYFFFFLFFFVCFYFFFFFSSRRRHTRSKRDWSSDVCSSDLTLFESVIVKNGIDGTSVEGLDDIPYAIPNLSVQYHPAKVGVPVLWWRSVGHSHNAFVKESFIDELAVLGGKDPFELRRRLLAKSPRDLGVLELAAEKAGWGKPLPAGRGRGIAVHASFESYTAQVAEVSVDSGGKARVHRVVCAVDCGRYVNPGIIEAQVQGAVIFGLTAAFYDEL